jgi:polysaccharide biosynthesis/export protein
MQREFKTTCRLLLSLAIPLIVAGCSHYRDLPAGTKMEINPVERQKISVPTVAATEEASPAADYVIGRNDVLFVSINGKQEFTLGSGNSSGKVQGSRVDGNGDIHLPLVGTVKVEGLAVGDAQKRIEESARKYLADPWVVVEIADYKSRPLYLLGQFRAPGTFYMDRPLNVMQGIALGSGFDSSANLRGARLTRDKKIVPVDIYDLLTKGDATQNIWLKPGDTIYIPDSLTRQVFIFGAVKKPGPVIMPASGLNLAQAIANAELRETGYDFRYVRIIRSLSTTRGELMIVDFDQVMRGEALPIQLMEGDIVYVPKSAFGNWNDIIAEILPSLQVISSSLQTFVNIKFLSQ